MEDLQIRRMEYQKSGTIAGQNDKKRSKRFSDQLAEKRKGLTDQ
jgi:hypothetical protein